MKFIFLGPPGAGKGTLAYQVSKIYGIPHISTGDMFRAAIKHQTELGKKIQQIINAGGLVDDETTIALVKERLSNADTVRGFILDGFPRTVIQAEGLATFCTLDAVVNFDIPDAAVITRLSGRRLCAACGKSFHIEFMKPKIEGVCDDCKGELYIREDDKIESITKRLEMYRVQTMPLIDFYAEKGLLKSIDAQPSVDEIVKNFVHLFPNTACSV
ncbi:MAG: adenylate kinase [Treponema sp.]